MESAFNEMTVNGVKLTEGQMMTIHAALVGYDHTLHDTKFPLGNDEHGRFMTDAYKKNIKSLYTLMIK
jgi:hypothetical protein